MTPLPPNVDPGCFFVCFFFLPAFTGYISKSKTAAESGQTHQYSEYKYGNDGALERKAAATLSHRDRNSNLSARDSTQWRATTDAIHWPPPAVAWWWAPPIGIVCCRCRSFLSGSPSVLPIISLHRTCFFFVFCFCSVAQDVALVDSGEVNTQYRALHVSMYAKFLSRWLHVFPRRQLHVVDGDRLVKDPWPEIERVERFLELEPLIRSDQFYFNATKGFYCLRETNHTGHKCLADTKGRRHPKVTQLTAHQPKKKGLTSFWRYPDLTQSFLFISKSSTSKSKGIL